MKSKISVVVNSRNEGHFLNKCLSSVAEWVDEIVVVDMESNDQTQEIAKRFKAKIFSHPPVNYIEPVREFAVSKATNPWVLLLDPDEEVPSLLAEKLKQISENNDVAAVKIPRLNIIFGKKIIHSNFWPDYQIRFFQKSKLKFFNVIHSHPQVLGEVLILPKDQKIALLHHSYNNIKEYWQRLHRYATIEAENRYQSGELFSLKNLFYKPLYDFVRRYIRHLGFLDGWRGLVLSLLQTYYYILVELKLRSLHS